MPIQNIYIPDLHNDTLKMKNRNFHQHLWPADDNQRLEREAFAKHDRACVRCRTYGQFPVKCLCSAAFVTICHSRVHSGPGRLQWRTIV